MSIAPANHVVAQPVSWLWPERIALGKLLILDGDPDLGKSLLALDLCARLSTGEPFPDGRPGPGPANALVLSAEDTAHDTIVPRLQRLGADLQRVFVWQRDRDDEDWPWRFPAHAGRLDEALSRTDARLAVIDPIMAFLDDSILSASDQSVRRALAPLMYLADKHRCALLMHRHLNKQGGTRAVYRGLGSIAFVAASRCAMLVARDPQAPDRCILAQVRNSLASPQPSLLYRLTAADGGLPIVDWLGTSRSRQTSFFPPSPAGSMLPATVPLPFWRSSWPPARAPHATFGRQPRKPIFPHARCSAPSESSTSAAVAFTPTAVR